MKSMCRRRPTSAALAIAVVVARQASCGVGAFVSPAPGAGIARSTFPSFLLASVEDTTVTDTSSSSNAASTEEKQETTGIGENPRKEGLALMLDDGELFAYPDCVDFELLAAASCSADEINRRRTMVEVPSETMYHGNLVVHPPSKKWTRRDEKKRRRAVLSRLWSRIRAS